MVWIDNVNWYWVTAILCITCLGWVYARFHLIRRPLTWLWVVVSLDRPSQGWSSPQRVLHWLQRPGSLPSSTLTCAAAAEDPVWCAYGTLTHTWLRSGASLCHQANRHTAHYVIQSTWKFCPSWVKRTLKGRPQNNYCWIGWLDDGWL